MQSQTIPKETFIIVIFGGMIRRYDSGYGSGYDSWVWFAELELPTLTKICTPEKKTQPYVYIYIYTYIQYVYMCVYIYIHVYTEGTCACVCLCMYIQTDMYNGFVPDISTLTNVSDFIVNPY